MKLKTTAQRMLLSLSVLFFSGAANATNYSWTGAQSLQWNDAGNWSPNGIPGTGDAVFINPTSSYPILSADVQLQQVSVNGSGINTNGYTITIAGDLLLNNAILPQAGNLISITGNSVSAIQIINSDITTSLSLEGKTISLSGSRFQGISRFVKNGATLSTSDGGNIFNATTYLTNNGLSGFQMGVASADTFAGVLYLKNTASSSPGAGTYLDMAYASGGNQFGNDIILESTTGTVYGCGIRFGEGGGSSTLMAGKHLLVGAAGYNTGRLILKNFLQQGTTLQQLLLNYGATTQYSATGPSSTYSQLVLGPGTVFEGDVRFQASNPVLNGCRFDGPNSTYIAKLIGGSSGVVNNGGNVFNSPADTLLNATTSTWTFAASDTDFFHGNLVIEQSLNGVPAPVFRMAWGAPTVFEGNLSFRYKTTSSASVGPVSFGANDLIFSGSQSQNIQRFINNAPASPGFAAYEVFPKMILNKQASDLNLHTSMNGLTISSSIRLKKGRFNTSTTAIPIIDAGGTWSDATDESYVAGPISKRGNTAFQFPVGKAGLLRPIIISAPGSTVVYTAEYMATGADPSYPVSSFAPSLGGVANKEYWLLSNTGTRDVTVTLTTGANSNLSFGMHQLVVVNWNGSQWINAGSGAFTGTSSNGSLQTAAAQTTSHTPFTFGIPDQLFTFLDQDLIRFECKRKAGKVEALFELPQDHSFLQIVLQRSSDEHHFIKDVTTIAGREVKKTIQTLIDSQPLPRTSYYRLKLTDASGRVVYSETKKLVFEEEFMITLSPNPARDQIRLSGFTDGLKTVRITDAGGYSRNCTVLNGMVDLRPFAAGMYWMELTSSSGQVITRSFIVRN